MTDSEKAVSKVFDLLQNYGHTNYVGEKVTCLQHSVQAAVCAEIDGASKEVCITITRAMHYTAIFQRL